jgi:hypothetical protein
MDWWIDLLTACIHHSELHFTDHWHTQTSVLSLLQSPLAISWQRLLPREILQLPALRSSCYSCLCRTLVNFQPSTNWVWGWLSINWTANSAVTHQPATSCHFTQLNCWQLQPTANLLLQTVLLVTSWHGTHRKHRSSVVTLVSIAAETWLLNCCLETGCITPFLYCVCVLRVLPINGCCLESNFLATGLCTTVYFYSRFIESEALKEK